MCAWTIEQLAPVANVGILGDIFHHKLSLRAGVSRLVKLMQVLRRVVNFTLKDALDCVYIQFSVEQGSSV